MVHNITPRGSWCFVFCAEFLHIPLSALVLYNTRWTTLDFRKCIKKIVVFRGVGVLNFALNFCIIPSLCWCFTMQGGLRWILANESMS